VAQDVDPEFKLQYRKRGKKKKRILSSPSVFTAGFLDNLVLLRDQMTEKHKPSQEQNPGRKLLNSSQRSH
jgi:hypothetical protein